jgi:hypothetical protein
LWNNTGLTERINEAYLFVSAMNCNQKKFFKNAPICPGGLLTRRDFLKGTVAAAAIATVPSINTAFSATSENSKVLPKNFVGIGLCKRYNHREVKKSLGKLFDQIGGVRTLVKNKRVTVKTNLVNTSGEDVYGVPLWLTVTVHPIVAMAMGSLFVEYGAKEVVFCDQLPFRSTDEEAFFGMDLILKNSTMQ